MREREEADKKLDGGQEDIDLHYFETFYFLCKFTNYFERTTLNMCVFLSNWFHINFFFNHQHLKLKGN